MTGNSLIVDDQAPCTKNEQKRTKPSSSRNKTTNITRPRPPTWSALKKEIWVDAPPRSSVPTVMLADESAVPAPSLCASNSPWRKFTAAAAVAAKITAVAAAAVTAATASAACCP